jgi:hypothetical protein
MKRLFYFLKRLFIREHQEAVNRETERINLIYSTFSKYYDSVINEMETTLEKCILAGDVNTFKATHTIFWTKFYNISFWATDILYQHPKGVNNQIECKNWKPTLDYLIDVNIKTNEVMASMINRFESNWGVIK